MKFTEFNLSESLLAGLKDVRFEEPTPIQEKAIPLIVEGKDVIGIAQTGTGKTGAFVIPIMERVLNSQREGVKALILSPTRELAKQIDEQIFAIGYHAGITSATVIGGSDFSVQAKALKAGVDIIVATPGRLIDQNKVVNIDFSKLEYLVLDEADRMLDMGFLPDMKKIISWLPDERQTLLFSATMPGEIKKLASSIMKNPESIEIERSKPASQVEQRAYFLRSNQKVALVKGIFDEADWDSCIIFTSTKKGTDELHRLLKKEGLKAASIHGDRSQDERNKALAAFKNGQVPIIVATDVLARGIDIKGVSMILNYDVPNNTDDYVHRVGRTGRYDKSGIAVTFVTKRDRRTFRGMENIKGNSIQTVNVPPNFSNPDDFTWEDGFDETDGGRKSKPTRKAKQSKKRTQRPKSVKRSGETSKQTSSDAPEKEKKSKQQKEQSVKTNNGKQQSDRQSKSKQKKSNGRSRDQKDNRSGRESRKGRSDQNNQNKPKKPRRDPETLPPVIEKAVERTKRKREPSKGVWGIVKSIIPRIKKR